MKWIPISERVPKDGERVLTSFENCNFILSSRYLIKSDGSGVFWVPGYGTANELGLKVNAWMTAPSAYRED